jgi:hypothetical protein
MRIEENKESSMYRIYVCLNLAFMTCTLHHRGLDEAPIGRSRSDGVISLRIFTLGALIYIRLKRQLAKHNPRIGPSQGALR